METGTKLALAQQSEGGMTAEKEQIVAEASRFAEKLSRTVDRLSDSSPIEKTPVARDMWNAFKADIRKIWTRSDTESSRDKDLKPARS